ncbi:MAG: trypsin-like peptidase domain-containing protein [Oryzihumus sp.]
MSDTLTVTSRFCTVCGAELHEGLCPRCTALPADQPATLSRGRAILALSVATLLIACVALAAAVIQGRQAEQSAATLAARVRAEAASRTQLRDQLSAEQAAVLKLTSQLGSLRATVESNKQKEPAAVASRVSASVFTIEVSGGLGSGFVVQSGAGRSLLVTNFHVVSDDWVNGRKAVKVHQKGRTWDGTVVRVSAGSDLALVQVGATFPSLKVSKQTPAVGDAVMAFGSPLGLNGTVSSGIVSALRKQDGRDYIQFSAAISPGNSGGPVVDSAGDVVGVSVMKMVGDSAENLAFAIPSIVVCSRLAVC